MNSNERSTILDLLRAGAIFLVLGRHLVPCPESTSVVLNWVTLKWRDGGWAGVDLFFVLSGFLVSGLLFREHQLHGEIRLKRFFMRRGLKIYPAFFAFLAITTPLVFLTEKKLEPGKVLAEALFLQNYFPALFHHTWSLAVEEHFYLLLGPVLVMILRKPGDPTARVCGLFGFVAGVCLLARLSLDGSIPYDFRIHSAPTHKRIDSLSAGVALSALFHYRNEAFVRWVARFRGVMIGTGAAVFTLPFLFAIEKNRWMWQAGYSVLFIGGMLLLAGVVTLNNPRNRLLAAGGKVGAYSYSIYLWHMVAAGWLVSLVGKVIPVRSSWYGYATVYLAGAIGLGVVMSKVVEYPVLKLRDRWFPSRSQADSSVKAEASRGISVCV